MLPAALQRLYGHAKDAYNKKDMPEAVVAFGRVLKILDDPDLILDKAAQGDMKMVAQGFIDLARRRGGPPAGRGALPGTTAFGASGAGERWKRSTWDEDNPQRRRVEGKHHTSAEGQHHARDQRQRGPNLEVGCQRSRS